MKFTLGLGSDDGVRQIREVEASDFDTAKKVYLALPEIQPELWETVDCVE